MFLILKKTKNKKPPSGLTNVDMPFITHITGEWQVSVRGTAPPLQSEFCNKGSQTKAPWVQVAQTSRWPGATLPQCVRAEGKGQKAVTGQKDVPKRDKEGAIIHLQSNTHSFWPVAF